MAALRPRVARRTSGVPQPLDVRRGRLRSCSRIGRVTSVVKPRPRSSRGAGRGRENCDSGRQTFHEHSPARTRRRWPQSRSGPPPPIDRNRGRRTSTWTRSHGLRAGGRRNPDRAAPLAEAERMIVGNSAGSIQCQPRTGTWAAGPRSRNHAAMAGLPGRFPRLPARRTRCPTGLQSHVVTLATSRASHRDLRRATNSAWWAAGWWRDRCARGNHRFGVRDRTTSMQKEEGGPAGRSPRVQRWSHRGSLAGKPQPSESDRTGRARVIPGLEIRLTANSATPPIYAQTARETAGGSGKGRHHLVVDELELLVDRRDVPGRDPSTPSPAGR